MFTTMSSTMAKNTKNDARGGARKKTVVSTVKVTPASHALIVKARVLSGADSMEAFFESDEVRRFFEQLVIRGYKAAEAEFLPPK